MLMGHKDGLALKDYVKPSTAQLIDEYLKVMDSVIVAEENRLKMQVKTMNEQEAWRNKMLVDMQKRFDEIEKRLAYRKIGLS
jgi:hypothetical protein